MGNDQNLFPAKGPYAVWEMEGDTQVVAVYIDSTYDGKPRLKWRGEVPDDQTLTLLTAFVGLIPPRPEPVLSLRTRIRRIVESAVYADGEYADEEDVDYYTDKIWEELGVVEDQE